MRARTGQRTAEGSTHVSTVLPLTVPHSSRIFHLVRVRVRVARAGLRAIVSGQWSVVRVRVSASPTSGRRWSH